MARNGKAVVRYGIVVATAGLVAGCTPTGGANPLSDAPATNAALAAATAPASGSGSRAIERDVEAPEVFQVADRGLWDGRPSLGGVWVAHPTATDPERVMIRNPATGASVIGALFRRERDNPGPRFQVSSEAATALGILAGAPTEIEVTALRLQRVEMEIEPAPAPTTAADETLALAPVEPAAATATPATGTPEPATATGPTAPQGAPTGEVAIAREEEPRRRGLFGLFGRRDAAPETPAIAETTLAPVAPVAETAVAAGATALAAAPASEPQAAPQAAPQPSERRGLFGLFRRQQPEPEPDTTLIAVPGAPTQATQATALAAPQAPTPQPAAQPAPSGPRPDRPFVQIGIFSVEQNAVNARARMQQAGLTAEIRRGRAGDNQFWRVVVGPAATLAQRDSNLAQVRRLGFADAYAVVR